MTRIEMLEEILPDKMDCALITSDVNRRYFSGMKSSAGTVAVFKDGAYLLIDFRYYEKACEIVKDCFVIEATDVYAQLDALMKEHGTENIYIEADCVTVAQLAKMQKELSSYSFNCTDTLSKHIKELRCVKSADELDKMQTAQNIADAAFDYVVNNVIKEGVSERTLGLELDCYMLSHGAESVSFDTIALCGANTSLPHGVPSDKKIAKGEFVLMDFGAVFEGYHSDMTRTVCVGKPDEEMKMIYGIVLEAQKKCLELVRVGTVCRELDACARDFITANGYGKNFGHGLGHSVGMEIHESPCANTRDMTAMKENTVMTVEPGIYLPKKFGVRIEDCVYTLGNGCVNFAKSPKNLIIL